MALGYFPGLFNALKRTKPMKKYIILFNVVHFFIAMCAIPMIYLAWDKTGYIFLLFIETLMFIFGLVVLKWFDNEY
jgi:hypothetical protein